MSKYSKILEQVESWFCYFILMLIMIIVFFAVINRFILNFNITWTEELSRYLMIWMTFVGSSIAVSRGMHISIDLIGSLNFSSKIIEKILNTILNFLCVIFCFLFCYVGYDFIGKLIVSGQVSPAMRIPIFYAYLSVPVGFLLMGIKYIFITLDLILKKDED